MRCERARELVSAYIDGELSPEDRRAVEAHMAECRACAAFAADIRKVGQSLAAVGREPLPKGLEARLRTSLARARGIEAHPVSPSRVAPRVRSSLSAVRSSLRYAAVLVVACLLSALATWWAATSFDQTALLERDVLAAHVRALLQDSPIQVASSDAHTVKPWFAGRLDFAPEVKDLAGDGFPLIGGRLDYVGDRRVGAVVYKRRLHTISMFMWPTAKPDAAPHAVTRNGYNLVSWHRHGLSYWAVSDLSAGDLAQLVSLL